MPAVRIQFDPNQSHQLAAVNAVVSLFEGFSALSVAEALGDEVRPNLPLSQRFERTWLLDNLNTVQRSAGMEESADLEMDSGFMVVGITQERFSSDTWEYPVFTVEMETGTGKTYVYLRTVFEMAKRYGFRKYVIVVPSVAIYEGVIKSFEMTREHFRSLYGNENCVLLSYDGNKPGLCRNFAVSSSITIMVMTLDSFNKKTNTIFKRTDKLPGELRPFEYLQAARPILILDESQNYRSKKARAALRTLKPLFGVNYSATPVDKPNPCHRLTPVDAFRQNLVKKIEVLGMVEAQSLAKRDDFLRLDSVQRSGKAITANVSAVVLKNDEKLVEQMTLKQRDDLSKKAKNQKYAGFVVREINLSEEYVEFSNDVRLFCNEPCAAQLPREALFKKMIEETIRAHFEKQMELEKRGIKALTLFFIDRVSNYTDEKGMIKVLFDRAFERLKKEEPRFKKLKAAEVRNGYFAKKKTGQIKAEEFADTALDEEDKTAADREAEKTAYHLIMRDKERLLSFDEPVSFIFAHSALREGWDNPNVFQICALREISSEKERRQSIGRGLRLPVGQTGTRLQDRELNTLTVIANESYQNYVANLQREYGVTGDVLPQVPANAAERPLAKRNDKVFCSADFRNFWNKLTTDTEYHINIESRQLIKESVKKLNESQPPEPHVVITRGGFVVTEYKISLITVKSESAKVRLEKIDTLGDSTVLEKTIKAGSELSRLANDPVLKGFRVTAIIGSGDDAQVKFTEGGALTAEKAICFSTEIGQSASSRTEREEIGDLPKFNIIARAAEALSLTIPTVLSIFKELSPENKKAFIKNPEGFAGHFIGIIR
ncbi:MAG TPA: type III restriction endonuclease subunit R, partial [Spirochaetia bacterium]|nr:type III restriction endonuclease subunit R [Spirochaetia bacterium]